MAINELDPVSLAFGALADPTRRAILARLASGDADVSELMRPFDLSQPTISKHLNVLERAGLVVRGRNAQRRPRTLVAVPLKDIADWMEPFRLFWEEKLFATAQIAENTQLQADPAHPAPIQGSDGGRAQGETTGQGTKSQT